VSTVVVACPYCPIMLRDAANHAKRDDIEILDLAEVVAKSIQRKPVTAPTKKLSGEPASPIEISRRRV